jgi:hypothetical protein
MGGGSATLLGFGHASHRRFNLGILIPTFSLSKKFSSKHSLIQRRGVDAAPQGSNGGKWRPEDAWSEKMATVPGRKGRLSKAQVSHERSECEGGAVLPQRKRGSDGSRPERVRKRCFLAAEAGC